MKWKALLDIEKRGPFYNPQHIETRFKNTNIIIELDQTRCIISLGGDEAEEAFHLIWELLSIYDGCFYPITRLYIDCKRKSTRFLYSLEYKKTHSYWFGMPCIEKDRDFSFSVLNKYYEFRNTGIESKKMNSTIMNAYYYLRSNAYGTVLSQHKLSLLLNLCDGFIINTEGDGILKNKYSDLLAICGLQSKIEKGIGLLGFKDLDIINYLVDERNQFDHYVYKDNSFSTHIFKSVDKKTDYLLWYLLYSFDIVFRVNVLNYIGSSIDTDARIQSIDFLNDWIIYNNDLDEDIKTGYYKLRQLIKTIG